MTDKPDDNVYRLSESEQGPASKPVGKPVPATKSGESADVYGVAEPVRTHRPESFASQQSRLDPAVPEASEDHPLSLEEIYARKRRAENEKFDRELEEAKVMRRPLPSRPFWTGVSIPLIRPAFLLRIGMMIAVSFLPFYLATLFFSDLLAKKYLTEGFKLTHFLYGIWEDKIVLFLFCILGGVLGAPYMLHIFGATANGDDNMDDWPEYNFIGGLAQLLWLAILIIMAGSPGYFVGMSIDCPTGGFVLSALVFFPILFLSCMETESLFTLLTRNISRSLFVLRRYWFSFYAITAIIFLVTVALTVFSLWMIAYSQSSPGVIPVTAFFLTVIFCVLPVCYLRFLGRLAWVITDERRKMQQLENGNEDNPDDENGENTPAKSDYWDMFRKFR